MKNELFAELSKNYKGQHTNEDYIKFYNMGYTNEVIAAIYCKNYFLFNQTSSRFFGVDDATRDSAIIEMIWKCLNDYDEAKSNGKITTMICTYIRNELRRITQENNNRKNEINTASKCSVFSDLETEDNKGYDVEVQGGYNDTELEYYLETINLQGNQKKYCDIVLDSKEELKMSDIAKELNISRAGALSIKRTLRTKLKDIIA